MTNIGEYTKGSLPNWYMTDLVKDMHLFSSHMGTGLTQTLSKWVTFLPPMTNLGWPWNSYNYLGPGGGGWCTWT